MYCTFNASRQVLSDWDCGIALSGCWCEIVRSYSGSRGYQRGRKNLRAAGSLNCVILTVFFFVLTEAVWEVYLFAGSPMFSDKVAESIFSKVTEVTRCGSNTHVLQSFADSLALKSMQFSPDVCSSKSKTVQKNRRAVHTYGTYLPTKQVQLQPLVSVLRSLGRRTIHASTKTKPSPIGPLGICRRVPKAVHLKNPKFSKHRTNCKDKEYAHTYKREPFGSLYANQATHRRHRVSLFRNDKLMPASALLVSSSKLKEAAVGNVLLKQVMPQHKRRNAVESPRRVLGRFEEVSTGIKMMLLTSCSCVPCKTANSVEPISWSIVAFCKSERLSDFTTSATI